MNSKKHWPSMFIKSKSSTTSGSQLPETSDASAMRLPYSELGQQSHNYLLESERRQPKSKSRWNPKPEQIRILEAIFQSGVVSPPGEEIKRIRAELEVFGQVADVNVFYWFQNRKARSKRRPRLPPVQRSKSRTQTAIPSSTSSTSTSRSTSTSVHSKTITEISKSPPNSMHGNIGDQYYCSSAVPVSSFAGIPSNLHAVYEEMSKTSTSFPSKTMSIPSNSPPYSMHSEIGDQYCFSSAGPVSSSAGHRYDLQIAYEEISNYNDISDMHAVGAAAERGGQSILNEETGGVMNSNPLITVFINDVPTAMPSGPINFRDLFGDNALLFHSTGHSVVVNEFGFTSLEHGAAYFLM